MSTTTPLEPADLVTLIDMVPASAEGFKLLGVNLEGIGALGDSFALRRNKKLLGCGGLIDVWPGVRAAWLVLTPYAKRYPLATFRAVRGFLVDRAYKDNLWRIEISIHSDAPKAAELAELLGFTYEGTRRKFLPDKQDAWMYAWVRDELCR